MICRRDVLLAAVMMPLAARAQTGPVWLSQRPPLKPVPSADALIAAAKLGGEVSFAALDRATGALIAGRRADLGQRPASTLKAITTLYALDRLGPDRRFRTRIIRAGDLLVLAGGGDPVLSTDDLATLAQRLVDSGTSSPARFAVWGGALPSIFEIEPAQADYLAYNPALSGIILNFNRVHLDWRQAGADYTMSLQARAASNSPVAYSVTAQSGAQTALFAYSADEAREHWVVSRVAMGRSGSRWLPVRKPELYAGDVFQTLCRAKGLVLPTPEVIERLPEGAEIAAIESAPLREILKDMMKYSTNLTAEVVGLQASGASSLAASGLAMADWLRRQGVAGDYRFADHSGLSADSRISPMALVAALAGSGQAADLRSLMTRDPLDDDLGHNPAPGVEIAAKTGTLNFVSNLAGYAEGPSGRQVVFAVMCTDETRRAASEGQELPAGVSSWTGRAKTLQRQLIDGWLRPA